ncbi:unnamed protein product [Tuber aestivum]|uniref:UvrD-like helicase ATP-binding domain-containing protein n=1 Tax=Tuber aestivum TaxID=59557 RepID=A0A292PKA4_9PEZI|nr:unnamed protein product [Tuber aestivum]
MYSSTGFFEFIFSDNPKDLKAAYESLDSKPYQIFDLLLSEERFTNFFSRMGVYGNNLANLLSQSPGFRKDSYSGLLLREMIGAFTLSLLTESFDDMNSRGAVARIVVSVVKLSDPRTIGHFGVRLGTLPAILRVLIQEGHIKKLALTHKQCFENLISEFQAKEQWVGFVVDLYKDCKVHGSRPKRTSDVELAKFIRTVPCEFCISSAPADRGHSKEPVRQPAGVQRHNFQPITEPDAFEHLLGEPLGPWKIILSQRAMEDLEETNRQGDLESVQRKFTELASGDWAGEKTLGRVEWGNELTYEIPLFKAFCNAGHFILWQIDAAFDERFGKDYQVIKVWTIGEPENLDKISVYIHRAQQAYTKARVKACEREDLDGSPGIRYPVQALLDSEESGIIGADDAFNGDFGGSAELAKFYSLTTTVLDNIASAAGKVAYPIAISSEEARVVDHFVTPAFILGRSGTGKTTCLVYKLAGRYLSSRGDEQPLRQVLLTRSKRLASKLRANTDGLIAARFGKGRVVSEATYAKKDDIDENTKKQFSSLADTEFPLVCTFDYLLRLIENSLRERENRSRYLTIDSSKCTRVVDFRKFNIEYWEHLSPGLKKGIPVDLAFLEIMGVIKGSVSVATDFKPLSREEYLGKRWRLAPNFASEQERGVVYDIYEWYERAKGRRRDIDQADRIIKVMRALEAFRSSEISEDNELEQNIRRILHEIYVDEVQDHRASEIGLLLTLVEYPRRIHFAGDTAQCISKDALFRFPNAKALFYERFRDSTSSTRDLIPTLLPLRHNFRSHKQILRVASLLMDLLYRGFPELVDELPPEVGDIPGPEPTLYIGNNITDVLKLLEKMEKPRESDTRSGKFHEYGEARVILVRDEETRDKLRTELGRSSLVLTILQSKGMEFEDVFLYDFLSTSPYRDRLNILEELFKRDHMDLSPGDGLGLEGEGESSRGSKYERRARRGGGYNLSAQVHHLDWAKDNIVSNYRYMVLCSELKNLYVGVTRARNKLCLLESNSSILNPVRRLFNQTASLLLPRKYPSPILKILEQDIGVSELHTRLSTGRTINASEWKEMGYQMIDDQQYSEALRCFENAECHHGITLANAYITEEIGLTKRARRLLEAAKLHFIEASDLFLQAGSIARAVQCRKEGGDLRGAARILAVSGAYEDAAWLAAEAGLFSEASGVYSKLNKHGKALAGYARGKQFTGLFEYIENFESEVEPCCRKQYVQFGYLKVFAESDTIPDEFEKRVINLIGSLQEQEMLLSRFNLMKKLFELLRTNGKYMEAYEVGINSGLLESSIQLLSNKILPRNPNWGQGPQLGAACKFLQAEHMATNSFLRTGGGGGIHKVLRAAVGRGSSQINSFVKMWDDFNRALDSADWNKTSIEIGKLEDIQVAGYVDILVTRSAHPNNEFWLPLDHIDRALEDLRIFSSRGTIPPSAQLYCGIYELPRQSGKYAVLDWSPFFDNSGPRPPHIPVDVESLKDKILRHILGDIVPSLASLDEGLRKIWSSKSGRQSVSPPALGETLFEKVDLLARLCGIFSEFSAILKGNRHPNDSLSRSCDYRFWRAVLLEQMEFRSSYEQSLEALFKTRTNFVAHNGKYRALYSALIEDDTTEYRIESAVQMGVGGCVSLFLAQYQTSLFLGYDRQWKLGLRELRDREWNRGNLSLKYGSEIVNLVHRFLSETETGDFPGRFCENIYSILGALGRSKNSHNFYSASVISLYEELALSLIFLVRSFEFLIPDSWHRLYFNRWEKKYRSPSALERFRYQQCLTKVCSSFCEMVINIEGRRSGEFALGRRSVTLIVVCLINLGTFFPRPLEYAELWRKSQEVFCCEGLNARGILGLREDKLIGRLAKVFQEYRGNDLIRLVMGHYRWVDSFAGIPLNRNGISVVRGHPIKLGKRHLWKASRDQSTRKLNAAHILTAFWKLNGPGFLRKMKELRRRLSAARILTNFWKMNGPGFLDKMKERRRYFAPRYKYSKNCCLVVDVREDKNWMY